MCVCVCVFVCSCLRTYVCLSVRLFSRMFLRAALRVAFAVRSFDSMFARLLFGSLAVGVAIAGSKISHRVHVMRPVVCARGARARRGDEVILSLAASGLASEAVPESDGFAEQRHVVGKHPVAPLNKALAGMCKGEQRKVTVFWDGEPGVQYIVELREIKASRKNKSA